MRNACYFVGTPIFNLTLHLSATAVQAICPNPTGRAFVSERTELGETFIWIGERICVIWTPRKLCESSPLLLLR